MGFVEDTGGTKGWYAFLGHFVVAALLVGPIAIWAAKAVSAEEAAKVKEQVIAEVKTQNAEMHKEVQEIQIKQSRFEVEIQYIKNNLDDIDRKTDRILEKLDEHSDTH